MGDLSPKMIEPTCFTKANKDSHWCMTMVEEFNALIQNLTWYLLPAHPNMNIVGCKWVYKIHQHVDSTIERYKARLVDKGFTQQHSLDYDETFIYIVKPITICIVLSLIGSKN